MRCLRKGVSALTTSFKKAPYPDTDHPRCLASFDGGFLGISDNLSAPSLASVQSPLTDLQDIYIHKVPKSIVSPLNFYSHAGAVLVLLRKPSSRNHAQLLPQLSKALWAIGDCYNGFLYGAPRDICRSIEQLASVQLPCARDAEDGGGS